MSDVDQILRRSQSIVSIFSAIAIPLVLAVAGYLVQKQIATEGVRKDYVGIATGVLSGEANDKNPELKEWAVKVITQYSPVEFSSEAIAGLGEGIYLMPTVPALPDVARQSEEIQECVPSCSAGFTSSINEWRVDLARSDSPEVVYDLLNEAIEKARIYASAADYSRVAGNTCERIYDVVGKNNE